MPLRPASRSSAMCGSAVLTTAMSSIRTAVASITTARVPFWIEVIGLLLAVGAFISSLSIGQGRCGGVAGLLRSRHSGPVNADDFDLEPGYLNTASIGVPPRSALDKLREAIDRWGAGHAEAP